MICHRFSVVSICTTSTYMTVAAVIMHPMPVDFSSSHLPLVRCDGMCGSRFNLLLLASLLSGVVVTSHRGVTWGDLMRSNRSRLVIQVLRCDRRLAWGFAWRVPALLLWGLVAGYSGLGTWRLTGVQSLARWSSWLLVRVIGCRSLCWRMWNDVLIVWDESPWWLRRGALVRLRRVTLEHNCWWFNFDFIAIAPTCSALFVPVRVSSWKRSESLIRSIKQGVICSHYLCKSPRGTTLLHVVHVLIYRGHLMRESGIVIIVIVILILVVWWSGRGLSRLLYLVDILWKVACLRCCSLFQVLVKVDTNHIISSTI